MDITLQQNCWNGFEPVTLPLPDDWDVAWHGIPGDDLPALSMEELREKLNHPYGMPPLKTLAQGKQRIVIVFDDITRATPTAILAKLVLEELHAAGIQKEQIIFICALGTHGAHSRLDFVKKLGEDIVANYAVYNHNPYENCVDIGTTSNGIHVLINKEFMEADLRIGLGALTPHPFNAFGGGGKLLFPGIAHIDTVQRNHGTAIGFLAKNKLNPVIAMGQLSNEGMRKEIEEMTSKVDNFFKIDCIYNTKFDIVDLFAGNAIDEYYAGVGRAQELYATPRLKDKDLVIANANAKGSEAAIALLMATLGVSEQGGDVVLVNFSPQGQMTHYLLGAFGKTTGGRMWGKLSKSKPNVRSVIYYSPYPDYSSRGWFGEPEKLYFTSDWNDVLAHLSHHGPGTRVGVLADATIQYYKD